MLGRVIRMAAIVAGLVVGWLAATSANDLTIRDLVRDAGVVPRPALPNNLLDTPVGSGADRSTDRDYIYAGWSLASGRFDTLHVLAFDRRTGAWKHRSYKEDWNGNASLAGGSVLEVRASPRFVSLDMHHSPSAGTTWVLRRDLTRAGAFYGWIKQLLPNELMVYEQSEIHFAPTHFVEISIYDPLAARSTPIYPIAGGSAVRREFVSGVKARWDALGEDWFRTHNHHGDPERFDSSSGRFAVDWDARGMAFEVRFDDFTGTQSGESAASERTIVSCDGLARAATVSCGEALEATWAHALPGADAEARLREAAAHPHLVAWR
jgi:hypothetical protein